MYEFTADISNAGNQLMAQIKSYSVKSGYKFKKLEYTDVYIPNRSVAWGISMLPEDSEQKQNLRDSIKEYNQYISSIEDIPGFVEAFIDNNFCLQKSFISAHWSEKTAEMVFSKPKSIFSTDIAIIDDSFIDTSVLVKYEVIINGETVVLPIGEAADKYANKVAGKTAIWNWVDNGHDFCYFLWEILGSRYYKDDESVDDSEAVSYSFDAYDQFRTEYTEPQLVRIFNKLESLGYAHTYTIYPRQYDPRWKIYCKSNASMDLAIIDTTFKKNTLLMEQIELLLWATPDNVQKLPYFLTEKDGKQRLSSEPGKFGGHNGLKIYGRLDCPSAARFLSKGQYIKHRVFFANEQTAIEAGYRPCAKCMPEAYKKWKVGLNNEM